MRLRSRDVFGDLYPERGHGLLGHQLPDGAARGAAVVDQRLEHDLDVGAGETEDAPGKE